MLFLSADDCVRIARRAIGPDVQVRDVGLIEAAVARPQATYQGRPVYADTVEMAAALTESVVNNHGLVDGNKRLGLVCLIVFLRMNGVRLTMTNDEAYDLIHDIASGQLRGVQDIAARLRERID